MYVKYMFRINYIYILYLKIVSKVTVYKMGSIVRCIQIDVYLKYVVLIVIRMETLPRHTSTLVISSKHRSSYRSVALYVYGCHIYSLFRSIALSVCSCDIYSLSRSVTLSVCNY